MKNYQYRINGADYNVNIDSISGNKAKVNVNGLAFDVEMLGTALSEDELPSVAATEAAAPAVAAPVKAEADSPAPAAGAAGEGTPVKAPLPGVVTSIKVAVGQSVKKGDTVVVLEAMKMENNIAAECDGTVSGIAVAQGASVLEGTVLVTIA